MIEFPFCRVQIGDTFTIEKRTNFIEMGKGKRYKVEDCFFTIANKGEFIIILEKIEFKDKDELKKHIAGKTVV
jgi:hypothetical protein